MTKTWLYPFKELLTYKIKPIWTNLIIPNWMKGSLEPDQIIGEDYMERWYLLPRYPGRLRLYLHKISRSDDDRALHDHPGNNFSLLLKGRYVEQLPGDFGEDGLLHPYQVENGTCEPCQYYYRFLGAGSFQYRKAHHAHRLIITDGPVWSIFYMGKKRREWGFHCKNGWRHWKIFTDYYNTGNSTSVGIGCE